MLDHLNGLRIVFHNSEAKQIKILISTEVVFIRADI